MRKLNSINYKYSVLSLTGMLFLSSCYDRENKITPDQTTDFQGTEFAPQMYHAKSYEPLSQVVDEESGLNYWPYLRVGGGSSDYDTLKDGHGEFYNSNYFNQFGMNMRQPVAGTVAKGKNEFKYNLNPDSTSVWTNVESPFQKTDQIIEEGKALYTAYCQHCHGENGDGKGPVGVVYGGVPNYHTKAYRSRTRGDIYHTITYGQGSMRPHAAQVDAVDRWKIAEYIKDWQSKVELEQGN